MTVPLRSTYLCLTAAATPWKNLGCHRFLRGPGRRAGAAILMQYKQLAQLKTGEFVASGARSFSSTLMRPREAAVSRSRTAASVSATTPDETEGFSKLFNLTFDHPEEAFASIRTVDLIRQASVLSLLRIQALSQNASALLALSTKLLGKPLTNFLIFHTLFNQFCGGEDLDGLLKTGKRLAEKRIGSIVDYAAECEDTAGDGASEAWLQSNVDLTKNAIKSADRLRLLEKGFTYVAVKMTSVCQPDILRKVTTALNFSHLLFKFASNDVSSLQETHRLLPRPSHHDQLIQAVVSKDQAVKALRTVWPAKFPTDQAATDMYEELAQLPGGPTAGMSGGVSYFQWTSYFTPEKLASFSVPVLPECPLSAPITAEAWLTEKDLNAWKVARDRMHDICTQAKDLHVRLLIDGEQTFYQTAIDDMTRELMQEFNNKSSGADDSSSSAESATEDDGVPGIISNTYQLYLQNGLGRLKCDAARADTLGYKFAAKLVRGAYMLQEARVATEQGYESPVHETIEETHQAYDSGVEFMLRRLPKSELLCGTHNETSAQKAARLLAELSSGHPQKFPVSFAQLLGMSDHISLELGHAGVRVYKYVPYGPIDLVMPYLIRRAEENGSMLSGSAKECRFMWSEVRRRILARGMPWLYSGRAVTQPATTTTHSA